MAVFESTLAYLNLIGEIKSITDLGYTNEYVKELLSKKRREYKNSNIEYDYNKDTSRTFKLIDGRYIILPYTPFEVAARIG